MFEIFHNQMLQTEIEGGGGGDWGRGGERRRGGGGEEEGDSQLQKLLKLEPCRSPGCTSPTRALPTKEEVGLSCLPKSAIKSDKKVSSFPGPFSFVK